MERAAERIAWAAGQAHDLVSFWDQCREALAVSVPHHLTPCWFTFDPTSLLITSHYDHGMIPELDPAWLAHEYFEEDVLTLAGVALDPRGIGTIHAATDGDPASSPGWSRFVAPYGGDQEVLVALRSRSNETWGMLTLYRERGQPMFDTGELKFLSSVSTALADGARRALLVGEAAEPDSPGAPGLVVIDEEWTVSSLTPAAERWLDELPDGEWAKSGRLPSSILAVAGRARQGAGTPERPGEVAVSRLLSRHGKWMTLHGAPMFSDGTLRVAVIIESSDPARIAPLLMAAYLLTEREKDVTRLVLQGESTDGIAAALFVSPHTVQQHLKSIFEKTGVRSRRELVGKVFFSHYEPRLRDNEARIAGGHPVRGGPAEQTRMHP